jgi:hypothetical protein
MSANKSLFESKIDKTLGGVFVLLFWSAGALFFGLIQHNLLLIGLSVVFAVGSLISFINKVFLSEIHVYDGYLTFQSGKSLKTIEYSNVKSVDISESSKSFTIQFHLLDNTSILISNSDVINYELFKLIIAEKICQEKIHLELAPKYKSELAKGKIK